jgi:hypothetical protein
MTPKKTLPHGLLPECAGNFATLTQQVAEITKDQLQIAELVFGNSKPGLRELTEANIRDIASNVQMIEEMIEVRKLETQARLAETQVREKETEDRKKEARKWWKGQVSSVITAVLVIIQTITIAVVLARLIPR